jgi:hypothetical protein
MCGPEKKSTYRLRRNVLGYGTRYCELLYLRIVYAPGHSFACTMHAHPPNDRERAGNKKEARSKMTSPASHMFASVCKYKLCTHDFSKRYDFRSRSCSRVLRQPPYLLQDLSGGSGVITLYLENKAFRRTGTQIFVFQAKKNWSR